MAMHTLEAGNDAAPDLLRGSLLRTGCIVAFCNRTRRLECEIITEKGRTVRYPAQWLCAIHWPLVAKDLKARHIKAKRAFKRDPSHQTASEEMEAWDACVKAANEAAAGI